MINQDYVFSGTLINPDEQGPVKFKSKLDMNYGHLLLEDINVVIRVPWITIYRVTYKSKKCYILSNYKDDAPVFGFIQDIVYINSRPIFVCTLNPTLGKDIQSYEIAIIVNVHQPNTYELTEKTLLNKTLPEVEDPPRLITIGDGKKSNLQTQIYVDKN
ncbi:hypothetical protein FQA39_LY10293 [Lamprigera yunnana]|nr:hypothetical protein FQA39_LY10293 [Lamprigera yunnana]